MDFTNIPTPKKIKVRIVVTYPNRNKVKYRLGSEDREIIFITGKERVPKYNLDLFKVKGRVYHEDRYDYSKVKEEHIKGVLSKVPIICRACGYEWEIVIAGHFRYKHGCLDCLDKVQWTLQKFLKKALEVHGEEYDYSKIKEEDIVDGSSYVLIKCNTCDYEWETNAKSHINNKCGCLQCVDHIKWTYDRLISKGREVHGDKYTYIDVDKKNITAKMYIKIECNHCSHIWSASIHNHINKKSGCPKCANSKGEIACVKYFKDNNIKYKTEYRIKSIKNRRYDFRFKYKGKNYILEFDGAQHFYEGGFFDKTVDLKERQKVDVKKTLEAIKAGFFIIRIHYSEIDRISFHIEEAFKISNKESYYFSSNTMYKFIEEKL